MTLAEPMSTAPTATAKKHRARQKPAKKAELATGRPLSIDAVDDKHTEDDKHTDPLDESAIVVPVSFEFHVEVIRQLRNRIDPARRSGFVEQAVLEKLGRDGVAEIAAWLEAVHGRPDPEEVDRIGRELFEGWGS
jgi:hypothetical protein